MLCMDCDSNSEMELIFEDDYLLEYQCPDCKAVAWVYKDTLDAPETLDTSDLPTQPIITIELGE